MAETVVVNGVRTARPGAYGEINGSGLARVEPGIKRVLLIGTSEGGTPVNVKTLGKPTIHTMTTPRQVKDLLRAGLLRDAALAALAASNDSRVQGPGGLALIKVNPATQSTASMSNGNGPALDLLSRDYGAHTARVTATLGLGTQKGYSFVATLDGETDSGDNIGGDPVFDARYDAGGDFATARLIVDSAGVRITFTDQLAAVGTDDPHVSGEAAKIVSDETYDVGQKVTVFGTLVDNTPASETLTLNGTTPVTGAVLFGRITGARLDGGTFGAITVSSASGDADPFSIDGVISETHDSGQAAEILSTDDTDTGFVVVEGLSAAGAPIVEHIKLNGTTPVAGALQFGKILRVRLQSAAAGNVTVRSETGHNTVFTISAGSLTAGVGIAAGIYIPTLAAYNGAIRMKHAEAPAAGTHIAVVRGLSTAGVAAAERVVLTANWATTTTLWSRIDQIEIGEADDTKAIDIDGTAINCPVGTHPTVAKVIEAINAAPGFYANARTPGVLAFGLGRLDHTDVSIKGANAIGIKADLDALIQWINGVGGHLVASRASGATGAPAIGTVQLAGGTEGTTTNAHWQAALDAARRLRDVVVVPLTTSPAVHAMWVAHAQHMEGLGGDERNGYVPISTSLTKDQVKAAVLLLNDRSTCAVAQSVDRYNDEGVRTTYGPEILAAMAAGMQAGTSIGEPLTWKGIDCLGVRQHDSWDPVDDANEMIQAGVMVAREDERRGTVWERSVTTWRADDNPAFTEMSATESVHESVKQLRTNLGLVVGEKAFDGRASTLQTSAIADLDRQVSDGVIKDYRAVSVTDGGASFVVEYACAPIEPTNFIIVRANLVRIPSSAA